MYSSDGLCSSEGFFALSLKKEHYLFFWILLLSPPFLYLRIVFTEIRHLQFLWKPSVAATNDDDDLN